MIRRSKGLKPRIAGRSGARPVAVAAAVVMGTGAAGGPGPLAVPAWAQQERGTLEEIVVTARYREESIQTTPLAISAFTGDDLELRGLESVQDVGLVIPNAFFREQTSNFGPTGTIGLRGVTQGDFSYAFEPAVGVYIDDVYHGTLSGSDMDLLDLERVEVLRGPQGTLFGKNSMGGAIRLISRRPEGSNSGSLRAAYGSYNRLDLRAVGDFALIEDRLFTRLVGVSNKRDGHGAALDFTCDMIRRGTPELAGIGDGIMGWDAQSGTPVMVTDPDDPAQVAADAAFSFPASRNVRQGDNCKLYALGGRQTSAGRVMLRFLASDRLELNLAADYSHTRADPGVDTQLTPAGGAINQAYDNAVIFPAYGIRFTEDDRFITGNPYTHYGSWAEPISGRTYSPLTTTDAWGVSATVDFEITEKTGVRLITAYRTYDSEWANDSDRTPFGITQTHYLQEHEQTQVELQFNGLVLEDRMQWTVGAFYYDSTSRAYNTTEFGAFDFSGLLPNFVADDGFTTESKSVFAHLDYNLTDRLRVSGGLRYTSEDKTNTFEHPPVIVVPDPLLFGDSRTDWKLSLDYALSDDLFVYTQAATGFRSEGATPRIFTIGQLQAISGEQVLTYEVGAKMDLWDRRVRINTAVFRSDYDPRVIQTGGVNQCDAPNEPNPVPYRLAGGVCPEGTFFAGSTGLPWFFYTNSPGRIEGAELELTSSPIDNLAINYSLGYVKYVNDDRDPTSDNFRHPSSLIQPKWNMSGGVQYTLAVGNAGTVTPRLDWFYQSRRTNGPVNLPNVCPEQCIPGYSLFNARLTYAPLEGGWSVSLSGTNVLDKFYWQQLGAGLTATGAIPADRAGVAGRPAEWLLTFDKRF